MADVIEIFADSGQVIERDFTPEELAQRATDAAVAEQAAADALAERERKEAARVSAIAKLSALGLDADEVAAILGGTQ